MNYNNIREIVQKKLLKPTREPSPFLLAINLQMNSERSSDDFDVNDDEKHEYINWPQNFSHEALLQHQLGMPTKANKMLIII